MPRLLNIAHSSLAPAESFKVSPEMRPLARLKVADALRLAQQLRQLGDVAGNPPRFIFAEQVAAERRPGSFS
jgi:hypothetical protein